AAARLLAGSVAADRPGDYEEQWRRTTRRYRLLTGGVLKAATSPLRSLIVPASCGLPRVFRGMVNLLAD
ncbi:monooxygenase, partial [Mycobacterium sp. ITM-2017-0098]